MHRGQLGGFLGEDSRESFQAHTKAMKSGPMKETQLFPSGQRLAVLYTVSSILLSAASMEKAASELLEAMGEGLDWDTGALWLYEPEADLLVCRAAWHSPAHISADFEQATLRSRLSPGMSLPGRVYESGTPFWSVDILQETNFLRAKQAQGEQLHSAFAFPIQGTHAVLGVVEFFSHEQRQPDEELFQAALTLGNQIGQFIERRRVEMERERLLANEQAIRLEAEAAMRRLEALLSITDTVLTYLALDDLLRELLVRIREVMEVDNAAILLIAEDGDYLTIRAVYGLEEEVAPQVRVPVGRGFAGSIAANAQPLIVEDPNSIDFVTPLLREKLRSLVGVPLLSQGRVIGVIHVGRVDARRFTQDDVQLLQRAADRVALAIHQSKLYEAEQRAREETVARAHQLEAMIESMADGVCIFDRDARIIQMNRVMREMVALDGQEMPFDFLSLTVEQRNRFMMMRDAQGLPLPVMQMPIARVLQGEVLQAQNTVDMIITTMHGKELQVNMSGAPVYDAQQRIMGAVMVVRDVTQRRELETRTHAALNALLEMARELVQAPAETELDAVMNADPLAPEKKVARRLAELTCSVLGCRRVGISIVEPETEIVRPVAVVGLPSDQERQWWADQEQQQTSLRDSPMPEMVKRWRSNEAIIIDMTKPPYNEQPNPYHVKVACFAPMIVGDQLVGLLSLDFGSIYHEYTGEEIALTKAVAKLAALVIERERLLRERAEARANEMALRESHHRMEEFLNAASHELRTPLTTIKGNVQLARRLLKGVDSSIIEAVGVTGRVEGMQGLLERADEQIGILGRLISDLLDASRIQANMLDMQLEPCDLAAIVQEVVDRQRRVIPRRDIRLEIPDEKRVCVKGDAERLAQVLTNYVVNALKFSDRAHPIYVRLTVEEDQARVSVRDEGPGLSKREQARIWESFYRSPGIEVQSGSSVGLGIGLHVCKNIIELHHGQVGVESIPGAGATFWFALPLCPQ